MDFKYHKYHCALDNSIERILYIAFDTRNATNYLSLELPAAIYDNTWFIIPTVTYQRVFYFGYGSTFYVTLKWLKWNIFSFKWHRGNPDNDIDIQDEDETADPQE